MTPRQADIAFVLEPLPGVMGVYAIDPGRRVAAYFDFAVRMEEGERIVAAVHYSLLRVSTYDDCARVFLFRRHPPTVIAEAARPLHLTSSEREAARRRVPPAEQREESTVQPPVRDPNALVVADDPEIVAVVRGVLKAPARWAIFSDVDAAVKLARGREFDLIVCDASRLRLRRTSRQASTGSRSTGSRPLRAARRQRRALASAGRRSHSHEATR